MSVEPTVPASLARTGIKAGGAFVFSVVKGVLLAAVLGGGVFFYYMTQLNGPGMPGVRAGGAAAVIVLLASPTLLIALVLFFFIPLYVFVGINHGRRSALRQLVAGHGDAISLRMAQAIAGRIESMPRAHGALRRTSDWLSVDALARQVAPVLGEGRAVRSVIGFVLKRVPLSDVAAQWQQERAERGVAEAAPPAGEGAAQDPALRGLLAQRIGETLRDMSQPSRTLLYIVLAAHAAVLGLGLWLTS